MRLTEEEERMLKGGDGYVTMKCMEYLVEYGEKAGAERLVDIDGIVDIRPGFTGVELFFSEININDPQLYGKHFKVPTYTNKPGPSFCIDGWEDLFPPLNDPEFHHKMMEGLKPYWRLGAVPTLTCDYYLVSSYNPTVGQHCSCTESSLIPWINAICGARTNYDGSFASAWTGKIPAFDMHLDENRLATRHIICEAGLRNDMDYDLFGWAVGEAMELEVPVITGIGKPTTSQIVKMNSTLNTGGQVRMYHVPGLTPEASTVEAALGGKEPVDTLVIKRGDLRKVYDKLQYADDENVDFVYLGCPHYTMNEVQKAVYLLEGKKCKANLWIMTNPWTFKMAEMMGYRDIIRRAGGVLASGSCPGMLGGEGFMPPNTKVMATDSAKQNYYITGLNYPSKLQAWYGTTEECIEAAVTGKWKGQWK